MQGHHLPRFLPQDEYVRQRTAIYSTVSSRAKITVVASSGPDFMYIERSLFRLLWENQAAPELEYVPQRIPWFFGKSDGRLLAGQQFAEVEPWFAGEANQALSMDDGALRKVTLDSLHACA